MSEEMRKRARAIIGRAFDRGTPYHGLVEIEQLLDEEESQEGYAPFGKQIVRDGKIVAQCKDEDIAADLTGYPRGNA